MSEFIPFQGLEAMMDADPLFRAIVDDRKAYFDRMYGATRRAGGFVIYPRIRGNHEERKPRLSFAPNGDAIALYSPPRASRAQQLLDLMPQHIGKIEPGSVFHALLETVGAVMDEQDRQFEEILKDPRTTLEPVPAAKEMGWEPEEEKTQPGLAPAELVPMGYPRWHAIVKDPVACYTCARATIHYLERSPTDKVALCIYCLQDLYEITPERTLVRKIAT